MRSSSSRPRTSPTPTSTTIGYWGFNKTERWALVTRTGGPYIWDFGFAAKAHRLQLPSLYDENNSARRQPRSPGCHRPHLGLPERMVAELKSVLRGRGRPRHAAGIDMAETDVPRAPAAGIEVRDGQQL